jgi:Flp pilus assembly protein TadG
MFSKIKNRIFHIADEGGQVAVIIAILMVVFVGIMSYAIDTGSLYETRRQLQTVADASVLAGVQELPKNPNTAIQAAINYAALNDLTLDPSNITISSTYVINDTITVNAINSNKQLYFAGIFGMNTTSVGASATAVAGSPEGYKGLVPWYVIVGEWVPGTDYDLYVSKSGSVSFNGESTGGSVYRDNIAYGYGSTIKIGDTIQCLNGFKTGPTKQGTETRVGPMPLDSFSSITEPLSGGGYRLAKPDTQLVICPVVTQATADNGNGPIIGFAPMIITSYDGKHVIGKFLNEALITDGNLIGYLDYGLKVVRLIK